MCYTGRLGGDIGNSKPINEIIETDIITKLIHSPIYHPSLPFILHILNISQETEIQGSEGQKEKIRS